jgi:WD40 repeat protein/beta-lactamase regulating signal transducer with metallopeptidase domain
MSTLLALGLANAACAALLAVPAFLVSRYGRRPALAHALWLLVLVKLVTPPVLRPGLPWLPAAAEEKAEAPPPKPTRWVAIDRPLTLPPLVNTNVLVPQSREPVFQVKPVKTVVVRLQAEARPAPAPAPAPAAEPQPAPPEDRGEALVCFALVVWLGGAIVFLARTILQVARFHRLLAHARLAPAEMQEQARELAAQMGLSRCPPVWLVPGPLPPMVWGVGRARVLFPAGLVERLGEAERASLLTHELAHVARRDHWVRVLELLAAALFWWYPLVWLARRQLRDREEECCDAWAKDAASPRVYATAILEAVEFLSEARPRLPMMASALAGVQALKERLTLIMTADRPRCLGGVARMALVCLSAAVLPLLPTLVRAERQEVKEPPRAAESPTFGQAAINLLAPPNEVYTVAFSRDGKRVAAGLGGYDRPGSIEMFDVASRKLLWRTFESRGVASLSFAPDGKRLAWSGWSGLAKIGDAVSPRLHLRLPLSDRNVRVRYSEDGKWLVAATEGRQLWLLDAMSGKVAHRFAGESLDYYCITFSPDSRYLGAGGGSFVGLSPTANWAAVYDVKTKQRVAKLVGHTRAVVGFAFAPKNELIATGSVDNTVRVWDGKTYQFKKALLGHTNVVHGVAFSPDGKLLATGSRDGSVRLWDPREGTELARLDGHPGEVQDLAFSPDGRLLVSGGEKRSVKLWDVMLRKEVATLSREAADPPAPRPAVAMAVARVGDLMALGDEGGHLLLRDARTGEMLRSVKAHDDALTALAFSRDGKLLATSGPDAVVKLWDAAGRKLLREFKGHTSWVYALAFSADGKYLASGAYDRAIRVWPTAGGPAKELNGHRASVRALAFSGDGKTLFSGGADKTIRIWDVETSETKTILKGHEASIRGLALIDRDRVLISAGEDGALKRWDLATGAEVAARAAPGARYVTLALSPGGQVLAAGQDGGAVETFDARTLTPGTRYPGSSKEVLGLAFAPRAAALYELDGNGAVRLWAMAPGPVRYFAGHKGPVRVAVFSPDGRQALSCGGWPEGDKTLRLWDVATGREVRTLLTGQRHLQSAAFTPDGKHALAGCDDGAVRMVEVATGKLVRTFRGHKDGVPHLAVSADGKRLLTSGHDKTVRLWDVETGDPVRVFNGHTDWVRYAVFHPDGKRVVSGGRDRMIRVWDIDSGKLLQSVEHGKDWVEAIAVLPGGKRLLTAGGNDIHLWDLDSGKRIRSYSGHAFGVTSLALARDGGTFLSSSYDGSVRVWDVESGAQLREFRGHRDWVWSVALAPDGRHFLSAGGGGQVGGKYVAGQDFTLRMWPMPGRVVAQGP